MKKFLFHPILFILFGLISQGAKSQVKFNSENQFLKPDFTPKSLYNLEYHNRPFFVKNPKSVKIGANGLFNFYELPLDRMICVVPDNQVHYHVNIYDPLSSSNYL